MMLATRSKRMSKRAISKSREFFIAPGADVAKLADAPDLGLRNHRFQTVAFHFKAKALYEGKNRFFV
jgi:hypothetical protein